jgi:hypothetical protein
MNKKLRKRLFLILIGVIIIASAIVLVIIYHNHRSNYPISISIQKQLNFIPFITVPTSFDPVSQPYNINYDKPDQLLVYKLNFEGQSLVVSQQATPQSFNDIPDVYNQLIIKMRGGTTFSTPAGTVNITYPKEYNGLQTAVMNSDGVLMFTRPTKNLSTGQWQRLFNQFITLHE